MEIKIGKFTIASDATQFILSYDAVKSEKSKDHAGEVFKDFCGYYTDMTSCLTGLHNHLCRRSDATSLQELIKEIQEYKALVLNNINPDEFPCLFRRKKKVAEIS